MRSFSLLGLLCAASAALADGTTPRLGEVLSKTANLTKFNDLVQKFPELLLELPSADGVTIIAPSDAAFANIPYTSLNGVWDPSNNDTTLAILRYHILHSSVNTASLTPGPTYMKASLLTDSKHTNVTGGQNVLISVDGDGTTILTSGLGSRCTVTNRDVAFQGGFVQVVDNFLVQPADILKTSDAFHVDSFVGALYAGGVMPAAGIRPSVTVFAPQQAAMDLVGGTLQHLNSTALSNIAKYHVVPGQVLSLSMLANASTLDTLLDGSKVTIRQAGNNKYVNAAQIVQPDILLANGILHIISDVLNPAAAAAVPDPNQGTQAPAFPTSKVENAFTSALPCTTNCPQPTSAQPSGATAATTTTTGSTKLGSSTKSGFAPRKTGNVVGAVVGLGLGMAML